MIARRRFLTILAGAAAAPGASLAAGQGLKVWRGVALGAEAKIAVDHPDARSLLTAARAEIARLEAIFSLYRADSAVSRLNAAGRLAAPPGEMLELISACARLHDETEGAFDPTVQALWATYARAYAQGRAPNREEIAAARTATGFRHVRFGAREIAFARPHMGLSFNGIAQGYIADKVAALFRRGGVRDTLIHTGETVARGDGPDGLGGWPVRLAADLSRPPARLKDAALATSASLGARFGALGPGHILDPRTGRPAPPRTVSLSAPTGLIADGLSTALCLIAPTRGRALCARHGAETLYFDAT